MGSVIRYQDSVVRDQVCVPTAGPCSRHPSTSPPSDLAGRLRMTPSGRTVKLSLPAPKESFGPAASNLIRRAALLATVRSLRVRFAIGNQSTSQPVSSFHHSIIPSFPHSRIPAFPHPLTPHLFSIARSRPATLPLVRIRGPSQPGAFPPAIPPGDPSAARA